MGKLLQKLVNGILPSWLTKIKSSAGASPKKLLSFSRGGTHVSSHKPSASSPASSTGVLALAGLDQGDQSGEDEDLCTEACGENTTISESPSLIKQGRTANMRQKADNNDDKHHRLQDHNSPHHPPLIMDVDVKAHDNRSHDSQSSGHPADLSSRKLQEILSIGKLDTDEHDQHGPWQHHRNCDNREHQHRLEHHGNYNDCEHQHRLEHHGNYNDRNHENKSQCMQEDAKHQQHQETWHIAHHVEPHQLQSKEFSELVREFQCLQQGDHFHQKDHAHGAHNGYEYHNKGYHDLLGFKRKYLEEKEGEEEEEEEEEERGGNGNSGSSGWKRRKGEKGLMSCEMPESICCIVGNTKAVVKHSQDPHLALWESMVEMIVGNGLWDLANLEFLLFCYLSLNEPYLHPIIQSSFLQVLKDLGRTC